MDTGADATCVPLQVVTALKAQPVGEVMVQVADGVARGHKTYSVELEVSGKRQMMEVVAMGDEVLVGRDLLNEFHITLDGPGRVLTIGE